MRKLSILLVPLFVLALVWSVGVNAIGYRTLAVQFGDLELGMSVDEVSEALGKLKPQFTRDCEDGREEHIYVLPNGKDVAPDLVSLFYSPDDRKLVKATYQRAAQQPEDSAG